MRCAFAIVAATVLNGAALPPSPADANPPTFSSDVTLSSLLSRGELVLTESNSDGTLKQVTAITYVNAPVEAIWARLTAYDSYQEWMPKVGSVEVSDRTEETATIKWEIDVPGPNYHYTMASTHDLDGWVIQQSQVAGSLDGSHWSWQLVPQGPNKTLVFRSVYTNVTDESWLAKQLDDKNHTLSFGVNITSCQLEIQALRRAAEASR